MNNTNKPINLQFISYDELIKQVHCEDNKRIIDDIFDINPLVPLLKDRPPIPIHYLLRGGKKIYKNKTE